MAFADIEFPQIFWHNMGLNSLYFPDGIPETPHPAGFEQEEFENALAHTEYSHEDFSTQENLTKIPVQAENNKGRSKAEDPLFQPLEPDKWPLIWQKQLMKTNRGKIAWTYWNLARDLAAARDAKDQEAASRKKRSALFRRLFADLNLISGTHTFWPACLPDANGAMCSNPQIFWSGILELNCRGVVILGSQAAISLLDQRGLKPLDELRMAGKIAWIIREPDSLAENASWYEMTLAFLRSAFRIHIH